MGQMEALAEVDHGQFLDWANREPIRVGQFQDSVWASPTSLKNRNGQVVQFGNENRGEWKIVARNRRPCRIGRWSREEKETHDARFVMAASSFCLQRKPSLPSLPVSPSSASNATQFIFPPLTSPQPLTGPVSPQSLPLPPPRCRKRVTASPASPFPQKVRRGAPPLGFLSWTDFVLLLIFVCRFFWFLFAFAHGTPGFFSHTFTVTDFFRFHFYVSTVS